MVGRQITIEPMLKLDSRLSSDAYYNLSNIELLGISLGESIAKDLVISFDDFFVTYDLDNTETNNTL